MSEEENKFLLKVKEAQDFLNKNAQSELSFIEKLCEKKVVVQKKDGHYFEGIITGYDMFQLYLLRDDGTEKILHCDIEGVKEIEEAKHE